MRKIANSRLLSYQWGPGETKWGLASKGTFRRTTYCESSVLYTKAVWQTEVYTSRWWSSSAIKTPAEHSHDALKPLALEPNVSEMNLMGHQSGCNRISQAMSSQILRSQSYSAERLWSLQMKCSKTVSAIVRQSTTSARSSASFSNQISAGTYTSAAGARSAPNWLLSMIRCRFICPNFSSRRRLSQPRPEFEHARKIWDSRGV